jgi:segregation and condensation protein A
MSVWQVKLPRFEGPLDLLLFLVARQEYDILDLPMAEITESYLAVIDSIGVENLEDAGEFVLMAATLLSIKVKMMLPRPKVDSEEEIEDPRRELAERLLLYQKVKEESEVFGEREAKMLDRWEMVHQPAPAAAQPGPEELLWPMSVYDLARCIEDILRRKDSQLVHQVKLHRVSLEARMRWILEILSEEERFGFLRRLQHEMDRMLWVVSLLAILEMTKRQLIRIEQNELFSEVYVSRMRVPELEVA